jgi:hypothetical protein
MPSVSKLAAVNYMQVVPQGMSVSLTKETEFKPRANRDRRINLWDMDTVYDKGYNPKVMDFAADKTAELNTQFHGKGVQAPKPTPVDHEKALLENDNFGLISNVDKLKNTIKKLKEKLMIAEQTAQAHGDNAEKLQAAVEHYRNHAVKATKRALDAESPA